MYISKRPVSIPQRADREMLSLKKIVVLSVHDNFAAHQNMLKPSDNEKYGRIGQNLANSGFWQNLAESIGIWQTLANGKNLADWLEMLLHLKICGHRCVI